MYVNCKNLKKVHILYSFRYASIPIFRKIHVIHVRKNRLLIKPNRLKLLQSYQTRNFSLIFKGVKGLLKIRYLLLGSAVGGGYQIKKKYEEFTSNLPDTQWLKDLAKQVWPEDLSEINKINNSLNNTIFKIKTKFNDISSVTNKWLEEAQQARQNSISSDNSSQKTSFKNINLNNEKTLQDELTKNKNYYLEEKEKLIQENLKLKRQISILEGKKKYKDFDENKHNKSLIEMYSEVLEELQNYESISNIQDILPRVVVVGDQSAGKTSVLEMIAGARIFPRGSGEMMTRSPVKVTLSEGPYHVAKFSNSDLEYDLKNDKDLENLRNEIEYRMKRDVKDGETVSKKVISLNIQGPNLNRVVLVDLPGIINVVTNEMSPETKKTIYEITNHYMSNPNAIILCVQDGSVDAEKSLVTDLVSKIDPDGHRTIFVLTKVDLAEKNLTNPNRLKKILDGNLFPMKALGYFAVVTGKGTKDENIESIKKYEDYFFKHSSFVQKGILDIKKCTTKNLSFQISDCFWKMIKFSIEQQADEFNAIRFNLETEWKSLFSKNRMLNRDELFEKVKSEILDDIINLTLLTPKYWEEKIFKNLWDNSKNLFFDKVYFPAYFSDNKLTKTKIELNLKDLNKIMPNISTESVIDVIIQEYKEILFNKPKNILFYNEILMKFKEFICDTKLKSQFKWEDKGINVLKILQTNAIQNLDIPDAKHWKSTIDFSYKIFLEKLKELDTEINELIGPTSFEKWFYWSKTTNDQVINFQIKSELEKKFNRINEKIEKISDDDLKIIKSNLENKNIITTDEQIDKIWNLILRRNILSDSLNKLGDCRNAYYHYKHNLTEDVDCEDVVLFWRIENLLNSTVRALRLQLTDREYKRLDKTIKNILDDIYDDKELMQKLFTGKNIELVEKYEKVKSIQKKLENFIIQLNKEK